MRRPSSILAEQALISLLIAIALVGVLVIASKAWIDAVIPVPEPATQAELDPSGLSY